MKKKLIIAIIIILVVFLPVIPFKQVVMCNVPPCSPATIKVHSIYQIIKSRVVYAYKKEQIESQKMVTITFENQPKVDGAGIVVKKQNGKFISRTSLSQYHDKVNIFLDNGSYIFFFFLGAEFIKSFNFDLNLNEGEKTTTRTIIW